MATKDANDGGRAERLATQLRENLKRRKEQARAQELVDRERKPVDP